MISKNNLELRLYQQTILNTALNYNTLVVIPTGLGKTMIAAALASLLIKKGRILFVAPTKPLALQHKGTFERYFEGDFAVLTGEVPVEQRKELWNKEVVFATPQTAENDLLRRLYNPLNFSLLIIDEAHRATGEYSYVWLANQFNCRLLALTASPASEKEKLDEVRRNLKIQRVEVRSELDPDVAPYIKKKEIIKVLVDLPEDILNIKKNIEVCLKLRLADLKSMNVIGSADLNRARKLELLRLQNSIAKTQDYSKYAAMSTIAACIKLLHAKELIETQGVKQLLDFFDTLGTQKSKASSSLLDDWNFKRAIALADSFRNKNLEHPKFVELVNLVKENAGKKIIIFTQYRSSVDQILKELEYIDGIKAAKFIGQKEGMTQKKQTETIEKFREGEYNVLVCTSISEEGLDIPAVPIAIFFEPVPSALRSIQRRGRVGRTEVGEVYMLITRDTIDEKYYWVAQHKEKRMGQILKDLKVNNNIQMKLRVDK